MFKLSLVAALFYFLVCVAASFAVVYIAWHFISKFW